MRRGLELCQTEEADPCGGSASSLSGKGTLRSWHGSGRRPATRSRGSTRTATAAASRSSSRERRRNVSPPIPTDADTVYVGLRDVRHPQDDRRRRPRGRSASCRSRACSRSPSRPSTALSTREPSRAASSEATTEARRGASSRRSSSCRRGRRGASRRDPGRRTCAGSRRARTTRTSCSSASSSAGSCARPTAGRRGTTIGPGAQRDVHSLAWHPHERGRAYEAGGGGSAWSDDAGDTWHPADDGRDRNYTWSVAVDPADPDCWYVSASTGPFAAHGGRDPQARIYRRRGGEPWQALGGGLPEPLPAMPYALVASDERLFAGLANGTLWESDDRGDTWRACALDGDELPAINALALTAES